MPMQCNINLSITSEDVTRLLNLNGRVEAVAGYLSRSSYVDRRTIADMLGIELQEEKKSAEDDSAVGDH